MARDFNGTTDRIDWASLYDPAGAAITLAAWVYIDEINRYQVVLSILDGNNVLGLEMRINSGSGQPYMLRNGTTLAYRLAAASSIAAGNWYHFTAAFDNSMTAANWIFYINGVASYVSAVNGATETAHTGNWSMGGRSSDDTRNFNGRVAEAGVWNRQLTQAEVTMLAAGYAPSFVRNGLQFYVSLMTLGYTDMVSGTVGTLDGTTVIASPAVIYKKTPLGVKPQSALLRM